MAVDALLQVSNSQSVAAASTVVSTDVVDLATGGGFGAVAGLTAQGRDRGAGRPAAAFVFFPTAGGGTLTVNVIGSATSNMATPTVLGSSGVIPAVELTAGRKPVEVSINPNPFKLQAEGLRYLALQYVTGAGTATTVTAHFGPRCSALSNNAFYDSAYTVV